MSDLDDLREGLTGEMRRGFDGVHARLDRLNGRVGSTEQTLARHDERLKTLFGRIAGKRADDPAQQGSWRELLKALAPLFLALAALAEVVRHLVMRP